MIRPLTIALLMTGCSVQSGFDFIVGEIYTEKDPRPFKGINPDLQEYVDRWEQDTKAAVVDIPIAIRDINPGKTLATIWQECSKIPKPWDEQTKEKCSYTAGQCQMTKTPSGKWYAWVSVDTQWWAKNKHQDIAVEQLVYHELGHCVLNLDHNDSTFVDDYGEWPSSIMNSYLFSDNELLNYFYEKYDVYIPELIGD